jgi:outer membrane protein TolC
LAAVVPTLAAGTSFLHQLITDTETLGDHPITIPAQNVVGANVTAALPVGNPRSWYARTTARKAIDVAQSELAERRRALAQRIVLAMVATVVAERVALVQRAGLRAALERLALVQAKERLGGGTALDIDRAQQDAATTRLAVLSADEALRQAREALGLLLGDAVGYAPPADLTSIEHAVADTCRLNESIEQRPDVVAAAQRVAQARRAIVDAKLRLAPALSLDSTLLWNNVVLYGPNTTWAVRTVLSVPLWDGGLSRALARDAAAAAEQAQQALANARRAALVNVAQAQRAVVVSSASRDVASDQRELALRIDQRTRAGYAKGVGTSLDLVTSAQALRQSELNLVMFEYQAVQAHVLALLANAQCSY